MSRAISMVFDTLQIPAEFELNEDRFWLKSILQVIDYKLEYFYYFTDMSTISISVSGTNIQKPAKSISYSPRNQFWRLVVFIHVNTPLHQEVVELQSESQTVKLRLSVLPFNLEIQNFSFRLADFQICSGCQLQLTLSGNHSTFSLKLLTFDWQLHYFEILFTSEIWEQGNR